MKSHRRKKILWVILAVFSGTLLLSGCFHEKALPKQEKGRLSEKEDTILLKALTMGEPPASGMEKIYEKLDELTIRDFGVILRFDFFSWGDEKNDISQAIMGKEYDLYCGGPWSDYTDLASKKAFANMNFMLIDVPELVNKYTQDGLELLEINGGLYGIPQYDKIEGKGEGILYREDLRTQKNIPEIEDFKSLEEFLYRVSEISSDTAMINNKDYYKKLWKLFLGEDYLFIGNSDFCVASKESPYTVISVFETKEYLESIQKAKQWYDDGIVDKGILGMSNGKASLYDMAEKEQPVEFCSYGSMIGESYLISLKKAMPDKELGWFSTSVKGSGIYKNSVNAEASMISIGAACQNPKIALKIIEKLHTDQEYYDLLMYGIENIHYQLMEDGALDYREIRAEQIWEGWTGGYDSELKREIYYGNEWDEIIREQNQVYDSYGEKNGENPLNGFLFVPNTLSHIMTALSDVKNQYLEPLEAGVSDNPELDLAVAIQKLKEAGFDDYKKEIQKQMDEFRQRNEAGN